MKIILLPIFIFSTLLFGFTDLGVYGSTHSIKEENFLDTVEKKAKDLNTTKLKQEFQKSERNFLRVKHLLPTCKKTKQRFFIPMFRVPTDVITPDGKVIAREGEMLNTLEVMAKSHVQLNGYYMFIDSEDKIQVQLSYMYHKQGKVFIVNGDMEEYEKLTGVQSYKADKLSIKKFGVQCSPSIITQEGNRLKIYEYDPRDLQKKAN